LEDNMDLRRLAEPSDRDWARLRKYRRLWGRLGPGGSDPGNGEEPRSAFPPNPDPWPPGPSPRAPVRRPGPRPILPPSGNTGPHALSPRLTLLGDEACGVSVVAC
jgi:hypothetical protein